MLSVVLHVEPVAGAGPIPERALAVDREVFVNAVQGVCKQRVSVLEEGVVDGTAGTREIVDGVEIKAGRNGHDDTVYRREGEHESVYPLGIPTSILEERAVDEAAQVMGL